MGLLGELLATELVFAGDGAETLQIKHRHRAAVGGRRRAI
jgi:hypothetical protein